MKENLWITDRAISGAGKGIQTGMSVDCNMCIELFDSNGIKEVRNVHNTITTAGKNAIADQILASPTLGKPEYMELGTGTPAATLLGSFISESRVGLSSKVRSDNVVTMVGDWGVGVGTGAITEAGVFDVITQNTVNMWMSASFAVINKGVSDTLRITWTLTVS